MNKEGMNLEEGVSKDVPDERPDTQPETTETEISTPGGTDVEVTEEKSDD